MEASWQFQVSLADMEERVTALRRQVAEENGWTVKRPWLLEQGDDVAITVDVTTGEMRNGIVVDVERSEADGTTIRYMQPGGVGVRSMHTNAEWVRVGAPPAPEPF